MLWINKGILFNKHHAQLPVVDVYPDFYKIYYSTRDFEGRSKPKWVKIEKNTFNVIEYAELPILNLGKPGSFDSYGVMPSCIYTREEDGWKFMYYVGWSKRIDVPYWNSIGIAISTDNGETWKKCSEGPYLMSNPSEPGFIGTIHCMPNGFEIYYSSAHWENIDNKLEPIYDIKSISGKTILELKDNEGGIAAFRPACGRFYYSKRNKSDYRTNPKNSYKIYSCDLKGKNERLEIIPSGNEIMCAYPFIIEEIDKYIMFYNSDFGKSGISYAIKMK